MHQLPGFENRGIIAQSKTTIVYRAIRKSDRLPVILKMSHKEYPTPSDIAGLKMEYEIARRLEHPGVIKSLELVPFRKTFLLVMEDFGGQSLSSELEKGPLPIPLFLDYAIKIADALGHIHKSGVIHKDLKPSNLVHNASTGRVCIIDFSIASRLSREKQRVVGYVREGSLQYISPEQTGRMNRPVDYRTDFYSLGVSFYELLTGRLPFSSQDPMELVHYHLAKTPAPVHELVPTVPRALSDIISRLMSKTAEERYQSAYGLMADLQHCLAQWEQRKEIEPFDLGRNDQQSSLQIPHKLYGREAEIDKLLRLFDQVCEGGTEMALVAGYSGVGKSALIEEIHKPIVKRRGYFISSKFDQYRRDIPYLSIRDAFKGLIRQLMAEPEEKVLAWKQQLLAGLDNMGQVIIDIIPEVQLLLGEQPPVIPLEGTEAQNRFVNVFEKFLGVFATREHPLVFFVDDLQWADLASLRLFESILDRKDSHHLLILGAYRDNEVNASHPLMLSLDKIQKHKTLHEIRLAPLNLQHTTQLIADTFRTSPEEVAPLAGLVHAKTHGNPFFLGQLLMSLHDQELIRYSFVDRKWTWELKQIQLADVTDQIVELMTAKIRKLDGPVQDLLKLAACLGNQFDFRTLMTISGKSEQRVLSLLFPAVQEGLLLSLDESFKYFASVEGELPSPSDNFQFKFLHDRVHEAAYALMSAEQRKVVHLRIGRTLRDSLDQIGLEERLFDVVNHLNLGVDYLVEQDDREGLARLNLLAGKKARSNTAHFAARDYLARGVALMGPGAWSRHYETMFQLHRDLTECEFLCGNKTRAEELFEIALAHAQDRRDKANIYELMMSVYMKYGRFIEGVNFGRRALRMYGIELPEDPSSFKRVLDEEFKTIQELISGRSIEELERIPASTDEDLEITMSLLHQTWSNSYFAEGLYDHGTIAALRIATLSLTRGYTSYTPFGYVTYGLNQSSVFGEYDTGYAFGALAVRLQRKFNNIHLVAKINNLFAHFISHYNRHISQNIAHYEESYQACLQTGDFWYGLWAVNFIPHVKFIKGDPLEEVYREALKYHDYAENSGNEMMFQLLNMDEHMILNLQGKSQDKLSFNGERYDEASMVAMLKSIPFDFGLFWYDLYKSFVLYLYGEFDRALEHSLSAEKNKATAPGLMLFVEQHFYHSLILCAVFERLDEARKERYRPVLQENLARLRKWATHGPDNYNHKYLLIQAELARLEGKTLEALALYEKAAEAATLSGALHNAAIANELTGRLLFSLGHNQAARGYMTEAMYLYDRWGAVRKVEDLEQKYGRLIPRTQVVHAPLILGNTTTTSSSGNELLDLASVLKASQTLSSELVLPELLRRMLGILIENAGAQKGVLLIQKDGEWVIVAEGSIQRPTQVFQSRPYHGSGSVCEAVIQFVLKTRENVVIQDARTHELFSSDEYISSNGVKSLLCIIISHQSRPSAILYFENNLASGAFTDERLAILRMLSTQVAISIENARLYANLEEYTLRLEQKVEERTHELREKNQQLEAKNQEILRAQQQLVIQEKMASLGTLTAGVAHEINNPTNFVNGSTQNLVRDLADFERFLLELAGDDADPEVVEALRSRMRSLSTHTQIILNGTDRIGAIVRDLQSFSRLHEAEFKRVRLTTGITSTLNLVRGSFQQWMTFETDFRDPLELECRPAELNQVFMNIIVNGCQAILSRFGRDEQKTGRLFIETWREGDLGFIAFEDNGCGMTPEVREKIFEPFFSTKPAGEGTGLGLSISYGIVQRHQGELRVESTQGSGSRFTIVLPAHQRQNGRERS
jgi:predicted ATPase/signal transduction histidine kinase